MWVSRAELESIKLKISELEKHVYAKINPLGMLSSGQKKPYEIKIRTAIYNSNLSSPHGLEVSEVSFRLPYLYWCRLKKLDSWHQVEDFLKAKRTEYTLHIPQEVEDKEEIQQS